MSKLTLYNTLTNQKEEFKSINSGKVGMYTCGPTVYGYIHIGNIRSYTTPDILRRYLKYLGYEIRHIKNVTDVGHLTEDDLAQGDSGEDKMIKKSKAEKKTPTEIAQFYENYFKETEKTINILPANYFPRATAHIPQMLKIIEKLLEKDFAYEKNGNVFFDITKFPNYGKLSGNTLENLKTNNRFTNPHPDKKNQWDFALWLKASKDHLMQWKSPWGMGYPGWHIECSAMSLEYLGENFDIHTGGEDNIFPHHEAEIAQTESFTGKKWVNFWVHTRHLLVDGEKMSKSKGNLYLLEDLEKKGFSAMDLRMLIISAHYRSQMNFTWNSLEQARKNRQTLTNFTNRLNETKRNQSTSENKFDIQNFKNDFEKAMNDDLNTPLALSIVFDFVKKINTVLDQKENVNLTTAKTFFEKIMNILGLDLAVEKISIPQEIIELAEERQKARSEKNWEKSDELREKINSQGFEIKDIEGKYELTKK
jgi:cysteinyl-tRNA synthetase